jgi:hypothetical protein
MTRPRCPHGQRLGGWIPSKAGGGVGPLLALTAALPVPSTVVALSSG